VLYSYYLITKLFYPGPRPLSQGMILLDDVNLVELNAFSINIRAKSIDYSVFFTHGGTITAFSQNQADVQPCKFLYKIRPETQPSTLRCIGMLILLENLAGKLNVSLSHPPGWIVQQTYRMEGNMPTNKYPVAIMIAHFPTWTLAPISTLSQVLISTEEQAVVYCVKSSERMAFSPKFWTMPFDMTSWVFIGVSCFCLTLLLKGEWFEIVSILMRQSCSILNNRRILVLFSLITIVLTYGYEGVVSSFLTAPSPLLIVNTIGDLVHDGYRIVVGRLNLVGDTPRWVKTIMNQTNLTEDQLTPLFVDGDRDSDFYGLFAHCNHTTFMDSGIRSKILLIEMNEEVKKVSGATCHSTKLGISGSEFALINLIWGPAHAEVGRWTRNLIEFGVLDLIRKFTDFVMVVPFLRRKEKQEYLDGLPVVFRFADWKIRSTFIGWAVLLNLAGIVFLLEVVREHHLTRTRVFVIAPLPRPSGDRQHEKIPLKRTTFEA